MVWYVFLTLFFQKKARKQQLQQNVMFSNAKWYIICKIPNKYEKNEKNVCKNVWNHSQIWSKMLYLYFLVEKISNGCFVLQNTLQSWWKKCIFLFFWNKSLARPGTMYENKGLRNHVFWFLTFFWFLCNFMH